jgi:PIN domain
MPVPPGRARRGSRSPGARSLGAVILLDTNQLLGKSPDAPSLRMLKKVAEQAGHDLVLPEIVAEEYLAHYRRDVEETTERIRAGIDKLH